MKSKFNYLLTVVVWQSVMKPFPSPRYAIRQPNTGLPAQSSIQTRVIQHHAADVYASCWPINCPDQVTRIINRGVNLIAVNDV